MWQCEGHHTYSAIAENLNVDKSTVMRTLNLFRNTGQVSKKAYHVNDTTRVLTSTGQFVVLSLVVSNPGIYIREIQRELNDVLMLDVSASTICNIFA